MVISTHLNTGHIHNHLVWNSVSIQTGKKYRSNEKSYVTGVRRISDELCRKYHLSVIDTEKSERVARPYAQWLAEQEGKPTWKTVIQQDVDAAIAASLTWKQFLRVLEQQGYTFRFDRKYMTLKPPGERAHRPVQDPGQKLHARSHSAPHPVSQALRTGWEKDTSRPWAAFPPWGKHSPASSPACGRFIIPTYIRWGVLRKKPPYPSYAVREDIRKLDQRIEQAEFIFQHHVEDRGQLASLRQQAEDEIAVLLKQRQKLYRYEPDSPQISALTEKLRQLRHTTKLCRNIETHSVEMEKRLLAAQEEDRQRQEKGKKNSKNVKRKTDQGGDRLNRIPSREQVERLRQRYPAGTRIVLHSMDDVQAPPPGTMGTVVYVDDMGQLGVEWDNGSALSLIPGEDSFSKVSAPEKEKQKRSRDLER